jgi:hypothetical protein
LPGAVPRKWDPPAITALAKQEGVSERHIAPVNKLAFPATDIMQAIIQGETPRTLFSDVLIKGFALDRNNQCQAFGFTAGHPPKPDWLNRQWRRSGRLAEISCSTDRLAGLNPPRLAGRNLLNYSKIVSDPRCAGQSLNWLAWWIVQQHNAIPHPARTLSTARACPVADALTRLLARVTLDRPR